MTATSLLSRPEPSSALRTAPVVAVLRANDAHDYDGVVDVLVQNEVTSIELTMSTPGTLDHLPDLVARCGAAADIGVGTVTSRETAAAVLDAGASFIVTPVLCLDVIALCVERGVPVFPGSFSPTEIHSAWHAGATAVKIFPASTVGPEYAKHLRGPFPDLEFVPSGGVGITDIEPWMRAGALAVSLGGPLLGDALNGGSLTELAARTTAAVEIARGAASR